MAVHLAIQGGHLPVVKLLMQKQPMLITEVKGRLGQLCCQTETIDVKLQNAYDVIVKRIL